MKKQGIHFTGIAVAVAAAVTLITQSPPDGDAVGAAGSTTGDLPRGENVGTMPANQGEAA